MMCKHMLPQTVGRAVAALIVWSATGALAQSSPGSNASLFPRSLEPTAYEPQTAQALSWPAFLLAPPQLHDVVPPPRYVLAPRGEGYAYDGARFSARILDDGTVSFEERQAQIDFHLRPPASLRPDVQPTEVFDPRWRAGSASIEGLDNGLLGSRLLTRPATSRASAIPNICILPDGFDACGCGEDLQPSDPKTIRACARIPSVIDGTFDLTDEYVWRFGKDPLALEKAAFLAATLDVRAKLAAAAQRQRLADAGDHLLDQIRRLWWDDPRSAPEKRRILFELWLAPDGPGSSSPAGSRRIIETFIQTHLPSTSPDGYTPEELKALRTRPGGEDFRP